MLSDRLAGYLNALARLAEQPANRWAGFDLSAVDARRTSLRDQIGFVGLALGALATHPAAGPAERERARAAVAALTMRLAQRRVWAAWATAAERMGRLPDPLGEGNAGFAGLLAAMLSLSDLLGGDPRLAEPLALRWSSDCWFSYDADGAAQALWRQARAHPDGAVESAPATAYPYEMGHVLWALHLHRLAHGGDHAAAGAPWLRALGERLALRGPRLLGRGALAGSYNTHRRTASLGGDSLSDAWALALLAPLAPELAGRLAPRYWAGTHALAARGEPLELAFAYVLATELGESPRAIELLAAIDARLEPVSDECGRRYTAAPAAPWVTALVAIGEAGGLGVLVGQGADSR